MSERYAAEADRLLAGLGETLGETLSFAQGRCDLRLEGRDISLFYSEEHSALFLQICLGPLEKVPDPEDGLAWLLRACHVWAGTAGGIFGLNPDDGGLYYNYRLDFPLSEEPVPDEFLVDLLPHMLGAIEAAEDALGISTPADAADGADAPPAGAGEESLLLV